MRWSKGRVQGQLFISRGSGDGMAEPSPAFQPSCTSRAWELQSSLLHASTWRDQSLLSMFTDPILLAETPKTTGNEHETPKGMRILFHSQTLPYPQV